MIAVLPAICPGELISALRRDLERRGWEVAVSRGREQTLLVVSGPENEEALEAVLGDRVEADVLSIRGARYYERSRRNRRRMHALMAGLAVLLALGLGIPVLGFLRAPYEVFAASEFVPVTTFERLRENSAQLVRIDSRPILLIRLNGARLFALSAVCTYMEDCQLEWSDARRQIICPCHGGVYDIYGNVVEGPPSVPLASFEIEVFGSEIRIRRPG